MIQELRRKLVTKRTGFTCLASQLPRSPAKMTEKRLPSLGVRGEPRGPDDTVHGGAGCRRKEWQKGVKALLFRGVKVGQMSVKHPEPKLWPILPEIRNLSLVKAPWDRR